MSPEEECSAPAAGGTDLPLWLQELHVSPGPPKRTRQHSAQEGSGAATCPITASAGAGASLSPEDSPTHHIYCGRLRRALSPQSTGQPLPDSTIGRILPRCTVQLQAPRTRCTLVCRIKRIRRHDPFHHAAYAASYAACTACVAQPTRLAASAAPT